MTFKSYIDSQCGIRYMFDALTLQSSCARKMLLESRIIRSISEIERSYLALNEVFKKLVIVDGQKGEVTSKNIQQIGEKLHCLRDITTTISRLDNNAILDDIELFEIKYLAIINEAVKEILTQENIESIKLPSVMEVIDILDPDKLKITSFYIYDSYSPELREIRGQIKGKTAQLEALSGKLDEKGGDNHNITKEELNKAILELNYKMSEIEGEIRGELSGKLKGFAFKLSVALKELANLDILIAKAVQIKEMGLSFPKISMDCKTTYKGVFHPQIKSVLEGKGGEFTPIDIEFALEPISIIGANMGGKTVVLKMLALSQLLYQFGFGVPAQEACIDIKNSILLCVGDEQNELEGLSSFAAEMKAIDAVLQRVKRGERVLALIDEPARTTNPVEGTALVSALIKVLNKKEVSVLLTTHYNIEGDYYKRLRVRGLVEGKMDYRLVEAVSGEIPHEAVEIAESLGIDKEWIGETKKVLSLKRGFKD